MRVEINPKNGLLFAPDSIAPSGKDRQKFLEGLPVTDVCVVGASIMDTEGNILVTLPAAGHKYTNQAYMWTRELTTGIGRPSDDEIYQAIRCPLQGIAIQFVPIAGVMRKIGTYSGSEGSKEVRDTLTIAGAAFIDDTNGIANYFSTLSNCDQPANIFEYTWVNPDNLPEGMELRNADFFNLVLQRQEEIRRLRFNPNAILPRPFVYKVYGSEKDPAFKEKAQLYAAQHPKRFGELVIT